MTARHFLTFGKSDHVQGLQKVLADIHSGLSLLPLSSTTVTSIRNYLVTLLVIQNGLRPSNLIPLTVKDVKNASLSADYSGMRVICNDKYKTFTIYRKKYIGISNHLDEQLLSYINHVRKYVKEASVCNNLFPKGENKPCLDSSSISDMLCSTFKKAQVFKS